MYTVIDHFVCYREKTELYRNQYLFTEVEVNYFFLKILSSDAFLIVLLLTLVERGAEYEFRIAARNAVDFGSYEAEVIKTPDGRK